MENQLVDPNGAGIIGGIIAGLMLVYKLASTFLPKLIPSLQQKDNTKEDIPFDKYDAGRMYQTQVVDHLKKISEIQRDSLYLISSIEERIERIDKDVREIRFETEISKRILTRIDNASTRLQ